LSVTMCTKVSVPATTINNNIMQLKLSRNTTTHATHLQMQKTFRQLHS